MAVFMFTLHAYRSWMPDHPRGFVIRGKGIQGPDPRLARRYHARARHERMVFDGERCEQIIEAVRIESPFNERSFHYRIGPNTFRTDYYVNFVAPPDRLLTAVVGEWMAAVGPYAVVVDAASNVAANLTLSCLVSELYGDYSDPSAPMAVVRASFFLVDDSEVESRVLFTKEYAEAMPAAGGEPATLATAWGAAMERILTALVSDLRHLE